MCSVVIVMLATLFLCPVCSVSSKLHKLNISVLILNASGKNRFHSSVTLCRSTRL